MKLSGLIYSLGGGYILGFSQHHSLHLRRSVGTNLDFLHQFFLISVNLVFIFSDPNILISNCKKIIPCTSIPLFTCQSGHSSDPDHHHDHHHPPRWTPPWVLVQSAMLSEIGSPPMMAPACQVNNIHIDPHRLKKIQSRMTNIRLQITNDKL